MRAVMTAGWGVRTIRAAVFASVCVLLAALGHVLMSGRSVPWWTLAAGVVLTAGAGWCLAGRERGLPLVVSVVVAAQGGLHTAFEFAQSSTSAPTAHDMGSLSAHGGSMDPMSMDAMSSIGSMGSSGSMSMGHMGMQHMDMGATSSLGMFAAHTLAALLCGLWLGHGERAAFRILRAVAGWLAAPLRLSLALPAPAHRPRLRPRRGRSDRAPRLLPLVHTITSRGPPAGIAVI